MKRAMTMVATVAVLAAVCGMTWADGRGWGGDKRGRGDRDNHVSIGFYQPSAWVRPVWVAPTPVYQTYTYVIPEPVYVYRPVPVYQPVYQPVPVYQPTYQPTYPVWQPRQYVPWGGITIRFSW